MITFRYGLDILFHFDYNPETHFHGECRMKSRERDRLPPYVTYATWRRLLDAFRRHLPARVDQSYLRDLDFSDSSILTIRTALYFLGLVDDLNEPTERLRKLAAAEDDGQQVVLREMIEEAYQPVLADLDLETATQGLLQERFAKCGATNNVGHKCLSFFLALAKDAGIPLSPNLLNKSRIGASQKKASLAPTATAPRRRRAGTSASRSPSARYTIGPAVAPFATKVPDFDPDWPKEVRDEWFEHLQSLQTIMAVMEKLPAFNPGWPDDLQTKWFDCMKQFVARSSL